MEESQDLSTVSTVAKRRGRKPKNMQALEQESTVPDFSEKSETKTEEEPRVRNKSKQEAPRSTVSWIDKKPEEVPKQRSTSDSDWGYARGSEGVTSHPTPETAYEWLGLRTVEPTMRPPILELSQSNEMRVAWASKDCTLAGSMLRRARPLRTLEASFFDRLELIRRIAVSEVAKAENAMEAVSVLGIVFDREALILGAEEVYGMSKGRELVLDTAPGNYDELSARIAADRRLRRNTRRRDMPGRADGKNVKPMSKGSTPYVSDKPFRERGTEVLHMPWCPRTSGTLAPSRGARRSSNRINEQALESLESFRRSKTPIPMASWRSIDSLEWPRAASADGRLYEETKQRNKERNESISERWSIQFYERERRSSSAGIPYPQTFRGEASHTRFALNKCAHSGPTLHPSRSERCVSCCDRQQLALLPRFTKRVSTSLYGSGSTQVPWCTHRREDSCIERVTIWAVPQPLCFHSSDQLGGGCTQEKDGIENWRLYRRLHSGLGDQRTVGRWTEDNTRSLQQSGHNTFRQEASSNCKTGRTSWISLVSRAQDNWNYRGTPQRIQTQNQESFENSTTCREMEECGGKVNFPQRSYRAHPQACAEYLKTLAGQEGWNENYTHTGSCRRSNLVVRDVEREERVKSLTERSEGINYHGCIRCGCRLCLGEGQYSNRKKLRHREHRCKHQCSRAGSAPEMFGEPWRYIRRNACTLVHRQYVGACCSNAARYSELVDTNLEYSKDYIGYYGEKTNKDSCQTCPRCIESSGRRFVQAWTGGRQMGGSLEDYSQQLGPNAIRSLWIREGFDRASRRHEVVRRKSLTKTSRCKIARVVRVTKVKDRPRDKKEPPVSLGMLCSCNYSDVEAISMVESVSGDEKGLVGSGTDPREDFQGMGDPKLTSALLDSFSHSNEGALWAPNTRKKYERILCRFVDWYTMKRNEGNKENNNDNNNLVNDPDIAALKPFIAPYLEYLAEHTTGENIVSIGNILLRALIHHLQAEESEQIKLLIKVLRQKANKLNPPLQQAADAVTIEDIRTLIRRSASVKMTPIEKVALDIFVVAFATTSRVAEICALTVNDVKANGGAISIRAKTFAKTCQRHIKKVSNGCGLYPTNILIGRRNRAMLEGVKLIFIVSSCQKEPLTSAAVTTALKQLARKTGMSGRISAHSARKGSAVTALVAGVPVVVIQSLGLWACVDSLQAYLGKAVRERFNVLELIDNVETWEGEWSRQKYENVAHRSTQDI